MNRNSMKNGPSVKHLNWNQDDMFNHNFKIYLTKDRFQYLFSLFTNILIHLFASKKFKIKNDHICQLKRAVREFVLTKSLFL